VAGSPGFDGVVLSGGQGRRFGADKTAVQLGGTSLLDRAVGALADARRVVVVGPRDPSAVVGPEVVRVREDPPGGGPGAALAAGLAEVGAPVVVVLAADLPFVDRDAVASLVTALDPAATSVAVAPVDGVVPVDADGRPQPLLAAYRTDALRRAVAAQDDLAGLSLRRLLAGLSLVHPRELAGSGTLADVDTPEDLTRARLTLFVEQVVADLGLDVSPADIRGPVLDLARDVAHGVARPAAPLTTFLLGLAAGQRGGDQAAVDSARADIERTLSRFTDG
jgi:molybdopterin-guanine dinucleotide biosynthesis protein A